MKLNPVYIDAVDIPDAWFQCLYNLYDYGFKHTVGLGSFEGNIRLEFDWVSIFISQPYAEPYDAMLPQIPLGLGIPNPVAFGYVEQYLPYLMTDVKAPNEDYTYGSRIYKQIDAIIQTLKATPETNQAILQVAQPSDIRLADPPCLRHIDIRIKEDTLIFYPYFRSWDLWSGLPANLASIAILQKYMADGIGISSGPMLASSKGLHIYEYVEELAKIRLYKNEQP